MIKEILFWGLMLSGVLQATAQTPDSWKVDPADFQYSMNITGIHVDDCNFSHDPANKVAAFVNGEVRGVATFSTTAGTRLLAFLTVYSNQNSGEQITFQVYHAGMDSVMEVVSTEIFQDNKVLGQVDSPYQFYDDGPGIFGHILEDDHVLSFSEHEDGNIYTWYFNGNLVAGNNSSSIEKCASGNYTVKVENLHGCTYTSEAIAIVAPPVKISLSQVTLPQTSGAGNQVGIISTNGCMVGEFTYTLVSGAGDTDNASFYISGNILFTSAGYSPDADNEFQIRLRSVDGQGGETEAELIISSGALGVMSSSLSAVSVYPNPTLSGNTRILLEFENSGTYTISILNLAGKVVAERRIVKPSGAVSYPLSLHCPPGTYIVRLADSSHQWSGLLTVY